MIYPGPVPLRRQTLTYKIDPRTERVNTVYNGRRPGQSGSLRVDLSY